MSLEWPLLQRPQDLVLLTKFSMMSFFNSAVGVCLLVKTLDWRFHHKKFEDEYILISGRPLWIWPSWDSLPWESYLKANSFCSGAVGRPVGTAVLWDPYLPIVSKEHLQYVPIAAPHSYCLKMDLFSINHEAPPRPTSAYFACWHPSGCKWASSQIFFFIEMMI